MLLLIMLEIKYFSAHLFPHEVYQNTAFLHDLKFQRVAKIPQIRF